MKSFVALSAAALLATAAPVERRNNGGGSNIDVTVLQYALTLEHLEATFYAQGLSQYSDSDFQNAGFDSQVRNRIQMIGEDEKVHVAFLSSALKSLNVTPTAACTYDFGYNSVETFLATSALLEGVGVSAYLGAAAYITDKMYLTAAASIYGVEARHASYVRNTIGRDPEPSPFETPLDFDEVYSLAALFIKSCPSSNPALPVKAFPALTATAVGKPVPGQKVKLTPADMKVLEGTGKVYAAWIGLLGTQFGEYSKSSMEVEIPYNAAGQSYVVLTTSNTAVTDDNILAGPAVFEVTALLSTTENLLNSFY